MASILSFLFCSLLLLRLLILLLSGRLFKAFYGMSSATAMNKHAGGVAEYRSSEGKAVKVPYRGGVLATIRCDASRLTLLSCCLAALFLAVLSLLYSHHSYFLLLYTYYDICCCCCCCPTFNTH